MPGTFVGETRLPKNFGRYAAQFSLLELDCDPGSIPSKARLRACRESAPADFVFSLVVPSRFASLDGSAEAEAAWRAAKNVSEVLAARWWVVRTPAEVRPTTRTKEQLGRLFATLSAGGMSVAWEPRGVWDDQDAAQTAESLGAHLVQDVARVEPLPGRVLYARLLGLARGAKVSLAAADRVVSRVQSFESAYVVVEGRGAKEIQQLIRAESELGEEPDESEEP